jgi:hypothetical protein
LKDQVCKIVPFENTIEEIEDVTEDQRWNSIFDPHEEIEMKSRIDSLMKQFEESIGMDIDDSDDNYFEFE